MWTFPPQPAVFLSDHDPPPGQQNHLRSEQGADLGEQHMAGQSKEDVRFEGGEPHYPLQISRVL